MSPIKTHKYQVNGINLNVAETGHGPALVLIHGWSSSWIGWTLLAEELAPHYHLYMLDLPGFGDSDGLPRYTVSLTAKLIKGFIDQYAPHPQAIIGASLGTLISGYTLHRYPHLTNNLILLGATFNQDSLKHAFKFLMKVLCYANKTRSTQLVVEKTIQSRYTAYLVEMFFNAYQFDRDKVDRFSLPARRKATGKSYIQLGLSASKIDLKQYLKHIHIPTLLIYGQVEKYTPASCARKIIANLGNPRLSLQVIPKAGHNPAYEQPVATASTIHQFLSL